MRPNLTESKRSQIKLNLAWFLEYVPTSTTLNKYNNYSAARSILSKGTLETNKYVQCEILSTKRGINWSEGGTQ